MVALKCQKPAFLAHKRNMVFEISPLEAEKSKFSNVVQITP